MMMEKVRYLFLSCSLMFLLGHSFVPHTHEYDKDTVQIRSCEQAVPQSLADLLASLFLQDLGSDHLTHFKPATDTPAANPLVFIWSNTEFSFFANTTLTEEVAFLPYQESFYSADGLRLAGNRGPPRMMYS